MKKTIILLLALALSVSFLTIVGCGNGASSDTPEGVVETFLKAAKDGDADAAYAVISEDSKAEIETKEDLVEGFSEGIESYEVGSSSVSGDKATVATTFTLKDMDVDLPFNVVLVKEGGAWKVSLPATELEIQNALQKLMEQYGGTTVE